MKRILLLTAVFIMMLGTSFSFAQADADNFYKSVFHNISQLFIIGFQRINIHLAKREWS